MSTTNPDGSLNVPAREGWSEESLAQLRELRLWDGFTEQQVLEEADMLRRPAPAHTISAETMEKFRAMWQE